MEPSRTTHTDMGRWTPMEGDVDEDEKKSGFVPIDEVPDPDGLDPEAALLAKETAGEGEQDFIPPVLSRDVDEFDIEDMSDDEDSNKHEVIGGKIGLHRDGAGRDGYSDVTERDRAKQPPNKGQKGRTDLPDTYQSA